MGEAAQKQGLVRSDRGNEDYLSRHDPQCVTSVTVNAHPYFTRNDFANIEMDQICLIRGQVAGQVAEPEARLDAL